MGIERQVFKEVSPDDLLECVQGYHADGWRFVQLCATTLDAGIELVYSFARGTELENAVVCMDDDAVLPSITGYYLAAFVFENETHDLFGVHFDGIAIDFNGRFYDVSVPTPMNPRSSVATSALDVRIVGKMEETAGRGEEGEGE